MTDLWQVTPDTLAVLQELHQTKLRLEQAALVKEEIIYIIHKYRLDNNISDRYYDISFLNFI